MSDFINPLNDFFFRSLMASEGQEGICRSLINAVLENSGFPQIKQLSIKNPFNLKTESGSKESITDIKGESEDGHRYTIEVQTSSQPSYEKRSLYYWAKNYAAQLHRPKTTKPFAP